MYESYREQRPLLGEDLSDEEFNIGSPRNQRRRHSAYSGRAAAKAKGAVEVITRWPDHVATLLAYWWAGLGMIALTIFILYNSISVISTEPFTNAIHLQEPKYKENLKNISSSNVDFLNMFMHIFINENEEISTETYTAYIQTMANKYPTFKYNLIIVVNDLHNVNNEAISDRKNNAIALSSLWIDKIQIDKKVWTKNISIQHISLSNYLDKSPLAIHWQGMSQQSIEFFVRCLAIWEKGGIVVHPSVVTSKPIYSMYMEKIQQILKKYTKYGRHKIMHKDSKHDLTGRRKPNYQVNNIRDIINKLNADDLEHNSLQINLTEAENREQRYSDKKNSKRDIQVTEIIGEQDVHKMEENIFNKFDNNSSKMLLVLNSKFNKSKPFSIGEKKDEELKKSSDADSSKGNLLPLFLKYIFNDKSNKSHSRISEGIDASTKIDASSELQVIETKYENESNNDINIIKLKPSNKSNYRSETIKLNDEVENHVENAELTIDLKGNLIATKTSCHAFIGNILSNIKHHSHDESVTDLIVAELSSFCKGTLSTCKGIEVILL